MDSRHARGSLRKAAVAIVAALLAAPTAQAQVPSGSTLSPDQQSFLVNKDLGNERWTINVNLFSTDPSDIINVTGSIFRADGGPASFVICQVRSDSTGTLTDPNSVFLIAAGVFMWVALWLRSKVAQSPPVTPAVAESVTAGETAIVPAPDRGITPPS